MLNKQSAYRIFWSIKWKQIISAGYLEYAEWHMNESER